MESYAARQAMAKTSQTATHCYFTMVGGGNGACDGRLATITLLTWIDSTQPSDLSSSVGPTLGSPASRLIEASSTRFPPASPLSPPSQSGSGGFLTVAAA